jgi:phosphoribosylglycinamide formyltransferase-1
LFAFPFVKRQPKDNGPAPYPDRPAQIMGFDVEAFCRRYGFGFRAMTGWQDENTVMFTGMDVWLHCTAKIVPPAFIDGRVILNVHPGLLPQNRGVDAFKWALVNGWPIGVTLHKIDEQIDRGTILYRHVVPILSDDTLPVVCERAYSFECDLLANFQDHLRWLTQPWLVGDEHPVSHKRIPAEIDAVLPKVFSRYCAYDNRA